MKKKITAILLAAAMVLSLTACGGNQKPNEGTTETTASSNENTSAGQSDNGQTTDNPIAGEIPSSYNGAYTDGTNYLVVNNGTIKINGKNCEVTKVSTDHFKSKIPVVYFLYEGNEISIFNDEYAMNCSLGQEDGSWSGFNAIDISEVPKFSDGNEEANTPTENAETYNSSAYAGITFTDSFAGRSITIDEVDADGCPTAITLGGNRTVFERHDDMSKDDHGWIVRVYWSELNGEHGDYACDIVYYSNDNHFEIRGHGFSGDYYLSDKIALE